MIINTKNKRPSISMGMVDQSSNIDRLEISSSTIDITRDNNSTRWIMDVKPQLIQTFDDPVRPLGFLMPWKRKDNQFLITSGVIHDYVWLDKNSDGTQKWVDVPGNEDELWISCDGSYCEDWEEGINVQWHFTRHKPTYTSMAALIGWCDPNNSYTVIALNTSNKKFILRPKWTYDYAFVVYAQAQAELEISGNGYLYIQPAQELTVNASTSLQGTAVFSSVTNFDTTAQDNLDATLTLDSNNDYVTTRLYGYLYSYLNGSLSQNATLTTSASAYTYGYMTNSLQMNLAFNANQGSMSTYTYIGMWVPKPEIQLVLVSI